MADWRAALHYDPIPPLLASGERPVAYFTHRDLLGQTTSHVQTLWDLPQA
jgi:hypothetical protein